MLVYHLRSWFKIVPRQTAGSLLNLSRISISSTPLLSIHGFHLKKHFLEILFIKTFNFGKSCNLLLLLLLWISGEILFLLFFFKGIRWVRCLVVAYNKFSNWLPALDISWGYVISFLNVVLLLGFSNFLWSSYNELCFIRLRLYLFLYVSILWFIFKRTIPRFIMIIII